MEESAEIPNFEESAARWRKDIEIEEQKIHKKAVELKLDPESTTFGFVLEIITGDDLNAFCAGLMDYSPEFSDYAKIKIGERIKWEAGHKNLPQALLEKLESTGKMLTEANWEGKDNFNSNYDLWRTNINDWTNDEIKNNPVFNKAYTDLLKARNEYKVG